MFRSLILAAVAAVGVAVPLSLPATADAHPPCRVVNHRVYHGCVPPPVTYCRPRPVVVCPPRPVVVCTPRVVHPCHVHYCR
jgi:hypothetical protein